MSTTPRQYLSRRPRETELFARRLAPYLAPGDVLALYGSLGAGKTCFTRGLVAGLTGGADAEVSSPTYALLNTYPTAPTVHHFDFYRLQDLDDLETTGYWDLLERRDAILVVEWPERVLAALDDETIRLHFEIVDANTRRIGLEGGAGRPALLELFSRGKEHDTK